MADAKQAVREFCAAWEAMDQQRILDAFTDDAVYHNMPMAPAQGKAAIKALLGFILTPASSVRFEIKHIVRELNTEADRLANLGIDSRVPVKL